MFCRNCGKEVHAQAVACPSCGVPPRLEKKFCPNCGAATESVQAMCTTCGASLATSSSIADSKKIASGLLAIFLGWLGIHKFYLGYNKEGLIMLLVTLIGGVLTCGAAAGVVSIVGVIEGIIYLTKSDGEFTQIYVEGRRGWF